MLNSLEEQAQRFRTEFDESFTRPLQLERPAEARYLVVRTHGQQVALPLEEVASVHARPTLASLPSRHPAFVGLLVRPGAWVPVFDWERSLFPDLPRLSDVPRVLVLRGAPPIALAARDTQIAAVLSDSLEVAPSGASSIGSILWDATRVAVLDVSHLREAILSVHRTPRE